MPLLDQAIRETLRLVMAHMTGLRKNELRDISFGDVTIPRNCKEHVSWFLHCGFTLRCAFSAFLAYAFADAHLDPKVLSG
jgi:hypothetical protein